MRALALALAGCLLAAGCSDDGQGPNEPLAASPTTSTSATASAVATPDASRSPESTGAVSPTTGPSAATPSHTSSTASGSPVAALQAPSAGRRVYDQTGTTSIRECMTRDEPAEPQSTLDVAAVSGGRQRGVRTTGGGKQTSTVEYRSDGVYLVDLLIEDSGTGRIEFRPPRPVLLYPARPQVSQKWTDTLRSTDSKYTVTMTNTVLRVDDSVRTGDGRTHSATRLRSDSKLTGTSELGPITIHVVTTSWISPRPVLALREVSDTDGTVSTCRVSGHLDAVMRSVTPG